MHVAIYARHSSDKQKHSTADQIARCKKWCEQKSYTVAHIFSDEEISGSHISTRQGLRNLIEASLLGDFDRVIAEDLSRISRDQEDIASFFKKMTFLDIEIETISEGVINELHIGLKGTMNALYLKDLADKTHRGMIAAVLNGSIPGGRAYGYDVVREVDSEGELIHGLRRINEKEAAIVREIYEMYVGGAILGRICDYLNRRAIPSPKGGKWNPSVLIGTRSRKTGILRQTLYAGVVTFNKMAYKKHPTTGKRLSIIRPEKEWIMVPAPDLAIIGKEAWDLTQELIELRSSMTKTRHRRVALLTHEEKKELRRKQDRKNRAKQVRQRKYKLRLVFDNAWCVYHQRKIGSIRGGIYSCHEPDCHNRTFSRNRMIELTQASMAAVTPRDLATHIKSECGKIAAIRSERTQLQMLLDTKRAEIANILRTFETGLPGREAKNYLDKKETECRRIIYDMNICNEKIAELGGDYTSKQLRSIYRKYSTTVQAHINDSYDEALNETLWSLINKIWITAEWNDEGEKYMPKVKVDLDFSTLLRTFSS